MKKDPALRYQHADDLAADLKAPGRVRGAGDRHAHGRGRRRPRNATETITSSAPTSGSPGRRRLPRRIVVPVAIVLVAALVYLLGPYRPSLKPEPPAAEAAQKSIAVLSFENLAEPGDPHGAAPIATSLLNVGLSESQVMPVVSAQRIHDVLRQMGKPNETVKGKEALEVAGRAGAAYVVTGYIYATQPDIVLAAEVASTSDGTVLTASKVRTAGGERGLFAAVDSLTASLRDGLARAGFGVRQSAVDVASLTTQSPMAYRAYVHGLDELYKSKWADAEREFRAAIAADSTFALAWYYAAVATWWNSDVDGAQQEVQTGLRLGDRLSRRDRDGLMALGAVIQKDYAGAARQYRALLVRYPDDKEFLYGLGEALYHGGMDDMGLSALGRATEIDPSFVVAYTHITDVLGDRGEYDRALTSIERLIRAEPDNPVGYSMKGEVLLQSGDLEGGLAAYHEALARDPRYLAALFGLAGAQGTMGDFDSLRATIDVVAGIPGYDGKPLDTAPGEVFLRLSQGRFSEAARMAASFERKLGGHYTRPDQTLVTRFHAQALLEMGRAEEAVQKFRVQAAQNNRILVVRGASSLHLMEALIRTGKLESAQAMLRGYERQLEKGATPLERQNLRFLGGQLALAKGHAAEAVKVFRENLPATQPGFRQWKRRWALARALIAAGDMAGAETELVAIVKSAPGSGDPIDTYKAMNTLARLYEERGRRDEALALYKRVAYQYRMAEPGVKANEEALAGIQRLSKPSS